MGVLHNMYLLFTGYKYDYKILSDKYIDKAIKILSNRYGTYNGKDIELDVDEDSNFTEFRECLLDEISKNDKVKATIWNDKNNNHKLIILFK